MGRKAKSFLSPEFSETGIFSAGRSRVFPAQLGLCRQAVAKMWRSTLLAPEGPVRWHFPWRLRKKHLQKGSGVNQLSPPRDPHASVAQRLRKLDFPAKDGEEPSAPGADKNHFLRPGGPGEDTGKVSASDAWVLPCLGLRRGWRVVPGVWCSGTRGTEQYFCQRRQGHTGDRGGW